jgi:transcription elongation factor Elf1
MGRKKSTAKKVKTKKKQVISTTFKCPFCGHDGAVEVKM